MQHFRPEVGEFHRLPVGHRFQQAGVRHLTRIAGIDAVDVGPDFTTVGAQAGGQHGGGVVRAVAPQHHQLAAFVTGGKARHQDHAVGRNMAGGDATRRFGDIDCRFQVVAVRQQHTDRIDNADAMASRLQQCFHNRDRELFATTDNRRVDAVGTLPQQANAVQRLLQLRELFIDQRLHLLQGEARLRSL